MSTQKGASTSKKAPNTLSSIVSNLVRSAIGGGNKHDHVADEDLDKYVADMIMMNAAESRAKYEKYGLAGSKTAGSLNTNSTDVKSLSNDKIKLASGVVIDRADSNGLKTNKRFLSSIIKHTDSHNQALIRSEEKRAAEAAKDLIAGLDRRAAERERQSGGRRPNTERMYRADDWGHPARPSTSSKSSNLSLSSRSKEARNSSPPQSGRMRMDEIGLEQNLFGRSGTDLKADNDTWKKTPLSPDSRSESEFESGSSTSPRSDSAARSKIDRSGPRSRSPVEHKSESKSRERHNSRGRERSKDRSSLKKTALGSSSSSGSMLGSRMDKYFQEGYDPLVDVHDEDEDKKTTSRTSKGSKKSKKRKSSRKEEKSKKSSDDPSKSKRHHRYRSESAGSEDDEVDDRKESKSKRHKSRRRSDTDLEDEKEEDKSRKTSSSRSSRTHRKSSSSRRDSDSDTDGRKEKDRKGSSSQSSRSRHKRSRRDSDAEDSDEDRKASTRRQRTSRLESGSESDGERKDSSSRSKRRRH